MHSYNKTVAHGSSSTNIQVQFCQYLYLIQNRKITKQNKLNKNQELKQLADLPWLLAPLLIIVDFDFVSLLFNKIRLSLNSNHEYISTKFTVDWRTLLSYKSDPR